MTMETLSKEQREVLNMLTNKFYTIKKIAKRRGVSESSVYKIVTKLRKKGYITRSFTRGLKKIISSNHSKNSKIRLHGQQFKIKILYKSDFYKKLIAQKNEMFMDGNPINLYEDSIIVSSNSLRDFWGKTADEAKSISSEYWNNLFFKLQDKLKLILIKGMNTSIKQFNGHFADVGNELAKKCNKERAKIIIKGGKKGLVWLIADKSWNVNELETVDPEKAQEDMQEVVDPFFNSLRSAKGYTPQMVLDSLGELGNITRELINYQKYYAKNLNSHVRAVQRLGVGVENLRSDISTLKKNMAQKKLGDWL